MTKLEFKRLIRYMDTLHDAYQATVTHPGDFSPRERDKAWWQWLAADMIFQSIMGRTLK